MLSEDRKRLMYHGMSIENESEIRGVLKNGLDERGIYLTPRIGIALAYPVYDRPGFEGTRYILEILIGDEGTPDSTIISDVRCPLTSDPKDPKWIEFFKKNYPGLSEDLKSKFVLLSYLNHRWVDFDEDPMGNPEFVRVFGDYTWYDYAQKLADQIGTQMGIKRRTDSLGNVLIRRAILPDEIVGAYRFLGESGGGEWECYKVYKQGLIRKGQTFQMISPTYQENG